MDVTDLPARWASKVVVVDGCWVWFGARSSAGYGSLKVDGLVRAAHRHIYECFVGAIPDGLVVHHQCHNKACVNPDHLEAVTHWENIIGDPDAWSAPRLNAAKTHCIHGHEFTAENTRRQAGRPLQRICRECRRDQQRRRRQRHLQDRSIPDAPPVGSQAACAGVGSSFRPSDPGATSLDGAAREAWHRG